METSHPIPGSAGPPSQKRQKPGNETDSDYEDTNEFQNEPRFLLMKSMDAEKPLSSVSPLAVFKTIKGVAGESVEVKRLRSGDYLMETDNKVYSKNLQKMQFVQSVPVKVEAHLSLNTSKGVVRSFDLKDCTTDEILHELKCEGVTHVKRIEITKNGNKVRTGTLILTFNTPILPSSIKLGYLRLQVDLFPRLLDQALIWFLTHIKNSSKKSSKS